MVEVIYTQCADHDPDKGYGGGRPTIHIHHIRREVFGNSIAIVVYGEIKMASRELVWAKELKLKTIQVLTLTPEVDRQVAAPGGYMADKSIYHKGEYGNYASIDIFDHAGAAQTAGVGPIDGSIWLDFVALGE